MKISPSKFLLSPIMAGIYVESSAAASQQRKLYHEKSYAVVANRLGGSVSFIPEDGDPNGTGDDVTTVEISGSEPMYVNANDENIWVGSRAQPNDKILVFDPDDIDDPSTIDLDVSQCDGVFHQWMNDKYYVVTCTVTKSLAVVNVDDMTVHQYIPLEDVGTCSPHDVVINDSDDIFVSTFGDCEENQIIKYSARNGREAKRIDVGEDVDPHLALHPSNNFLYSPEQSPTGTVNVYQQSNLKKVQTLVVTNAHGICFSPDGTMLHVTDLTGMNGSPGKRLVGIKPMGKISGEGIFGHFHGLLFGNSRNAALTGINGVAGATPGGGFHNCAQTKSGKIFVTHSGGTQNEVSLFDMGCMQLVNEGFFVTAGNPFGIGIFHGDLD